MLKVIRILRVSKVIRNMNVSIQIKVALKIMALFLYLMLYILILSCVWYLMVKSEQMWLLNMDFIWFEYEKSYEVYYRDDWVLQFLLCYYTGFFLFGVGEVVPRYITEIVIATFILLSSAIVNALVIGNMAIL